MSERRGLPAFGIALDGAAMTIAWRVPNTGKWREETVACDGTDAGVRSALEELAPFAPAAGTINVTLVRPLVNIVRPDLPRMSHAAAEHVLSRDWSRHIIAHRPTPHSVAAEWRAGRWRAAFAPADILDELTTAADRYGWRTLTIQAGDDAIAAVARDATDSEAAEALCAIVVGEGSRAQGAQLERGAPVSGRIFPGDVSHADVTAFAADQSAVLVIGSAPQAHALTSELGAEGVRTSAFAFNGITSALGNFAAAGTRGEAALLLEAGATVTRRERKMRRVGQLLWVGAAAAILVAFMIERTRVSSALESTQRTRADLSPRVRGVLAAQERIEAETQAATVLAAREAGASRVTAVMASVATAIPAGTLLTALGVSGDTVTIEGESKGSAAVYNALRAVPELEQLRLGVPLRQDRLASDQAVEHFVFTARVRRAGVPAR